jgi:hypothetical protein
VLQRAGAILGTVTDSDDPPAPAGGIAVRIGVILGENDAYWFGESTTDVDGSFAHYGLYPGGYHVSFEDPEGRFFGESYCDKDDFWASDEIAVSAGGTVPIAAQLNAIPRIIGRLVGGDGNGIAGVDIQIHRLIDLDQWQGGWGAQTDENGWFTAQVQPGTHRVMFACSTPGWAKQCYGSEDPWDESGCALVTVDANEVVTLPDQVLQPGAWITGRVTQDGPDPAVPLGGIEVRAFVAMGDATIAFLNATSTASDGNLHDLRPESRQGLHPRVLACRRRRPL